MDWYSVYIKLTISDYVKQYIVKGQESDFLPNAKMQQIAKHLKQLHESKRY